MLVFWQCITFSLNWVILNVWSVIIICSHLQCLSSLDVVDEVSPSLPVYIERIFFIHSILIWFFHFLQGFSPGRFPDIGLSNQNGCLVWFVLLTILHTILAFLFCCFRCLQYTSGRRSLWPATLQVVLRCRNQIVSRIPLRRLRRQREPIQFSQRVRKHLSLPRGTHSWDKQLPFILRYVLVKVIVTFGMV